jgi:cyanobactin maturation PatA/PatG family protease
MTDVASIPGLRELWARTLGDARIAIAVLDGPVDRSHPCFAGAELTQLETLVRGVARDGPASRHGTHVASVIFGQHHGPVKGIAPRCRGISVPIFQDGPDGELGHCSQLDLARAIGLALSAGAHVINVSGGQYSPTGTAHPLLTQAVQRCADMGVLIVAAVGNEGCDCSQVPGALASVLAVGAMDDRGEPLEFSNWGKAYQTQGILAPGEQVLGALPGGSTFALTGTSSATAIVSGVAALLLDLQRRLGDKPNAQVVRRFLLDSAIGCSYQVGDTCRRILVGRLNISGAVAHIIPNKTVVGDHPMAEPGESGGALPTSAVAETGTQDTVRAASTSPPTGVHDHHAQAAYQAGEPWSTLARSLSPSPAMSADLIGPHEAPAGRTSASPRGEASGGCGCGCRSGAAPQMVFALGVLGYDFGTEARRDSFAQLLQGDPHDHKRLADHIRKDPWDAADVTWTLNLDTTPVYALRPQGPYAGHCCDRIIQFLSDQLTEGVERVSVPGWIVGSTRLLSGQVVPVIDPVMRGMYSWTTQALVKAACGDPPAEQAPAQDKERYAERTRAVGNFLTRVYEELRNLGLTPQERAINYSATNALLISQVYEDALKEGMDLDRVEVERSPICRPESDCWDVKATFFDPRRLHERARKLYRFTVDVSDVVPVMVGGVRSWFVR